jgi:hypothetical protein
MGYDISRRGQDLTQIGLGADLYNRGAQGPWGSLQNANNIFNATAKENYTTTANEQQGGGALGALGGLLSGATFANNQGWFKPWAS